MRSEHVVETPARDLAVVPGWPAQRMVVQLMEGHENLSETLESVRDVGASFVAIDLRPGDKVNIRGHGIDAVISDVRQVLQ